MNPEIVTKKWVDVGMDRRSDGKSVKISYTVLFHWWSAVAVAKARQNTTVASPFLGLCVDSMVMCDLDLGCGWRQRTLR